MDICRCGASGMMEDFQTAFQRRVSVEGLGFRASGMMEDFKTAFQRRVSVAPTIPTSMRMTSDDLLPFNRVRNIH